MTTNIGATDRLIRLFLDLAAVVIAWFVGTGGVAGIILLVVAAILTLTAIVRLCPIYRSLGASTAGDRS